MANERQLLSELTATARQLESTGTRCTADLMFRAAEAVEAHLDRIAELERELQCLMR